MCFINIIKKNFCYNKQVNLNKEIFFIFLYYFHYFINNSENKNKLLLYNNNLFLLLYNNNLFSLYFYIIFFLLKKYINIDPFFIMNKFFLIFITFISYNKSLLIYTKKFFKKKKFLKIYFFNDIIFRFDIFFLFRNWDYIKFFKFYKYNEYINSHIKLFEFPYLKLFLRKFFSNIITKKNYLKFCGKKLINYNIQYYLINRKFIMSKFINYFSKFKLLLDNLKILKLYFLILKLKNIINYIFIKKYNLLYFFLFIYNIWLYYFEDIDWVEIKKLKINNFFMLYWKLNRYGFKLNSWVDLYSLKYILIFFFNTNKLNIINFEFIQNKSKYLIKKFSNIFLYKILHLIFLEYIYSLFFKFLGTWDNKKIKKFVKSWIKHWIILKRSFIFDWINIKYITIKMIYNNLNYIMYSLLFLGNLNLTYNFNYNLLNIQKKIILDNFFLNIKTYFFNLLNYFLKTKLINNFLMFVLLIKDLQIKLLFNNLLIFTKIYLKNNIYILKNYMKINCFHNFIENNKTFFLFFYKNNIYIYIYIIFIYFWFLIEE